MKSASSPRRTALRVWCALSGHGFGHLAQLAPIIRRLSQQVELKLHLTGFPHRAVLADALGHPFSHDPRPRDVGLVQHDPLRVEREETLAAITALHREQKHFFAEEKAAMAHFSPDLLLANVPYFPFSVAASLGIPSIAIASLSWDHVLAAYFPMDESPGREFRALMAEGYGQATLALLPTPAIEGETFPRQKVIPPLAQVGQRRPQALRQALSLAPEEKRPLVLVSLGGIPPRNFPVAALSQEKSLLWLTNIDQLPSAPHLLHIRSLTGWSFADILASVDAVVSKPGYGMAVATTAHGIPMLYVRRGQFPDETPICRWLHQNNRAHEITMADFMAGCGWEDAINHLLEQVAPPFPLISGDETAVENILNTLS